MTSDSKMLAKQTHLSNDPILSLTLPRDAPGGSRTHEKARSLTSISSLCFMPSVTGSHCSDGNSEALDANCRQDSLDEVGEIDEHLLFKCRSLAQAAKGSSAGQSSAAMELAGRFLISAYRDGRTLLWDLGRQRVVSTTSMLMNRGPVTLLRRNDATFRSAQSLLFQTRDEQGTVSLHDATQLNIPLLNSVATKSLTFCAACPCNHNSNLVVLPDHVDSVATVRDWRLSGSNQPIVAIQNSDAENINGMLMSLGFSETTTVASGRPILACGMESGRVLFYDLAMPSMPLMSSQATFSQSCLLTSSSSLQLGRDPVLSLDMTPARDSTFGQSASGHAEGVVTIAGLAADRDDLAGITEEQSGTVAVMKAIRSGESDKTLQARVRSRRATCHKSNDPTSLVAGKPGVSLCRFRPDGRIFAVGGWDKRLRLYDRADSAAPLAIMRGHADSVNAIDWAPDAADSGILATGADDGRILIWQCLQKRRKNNAAA
ncbi:hypothetical protein MPSEU_000522400 [Mayamaea pseudoterrestris]|nr:hypothetical protein MPSEU_000522400 [Mayamaea pseudoterrestris]